MFNSAYPTQLIFVYENGAVYSIITGTTAKTFLITNSIMCSATLSTIATNSVVANVSNNLLLNGDLA